MTIRPGSAKDEPALRSFLSGLCPEARHLRFFSGAVDIADAAHLSAATDERHVGLIAHNEAGAVVGHAMYVQFEHERERAEVAVEVADDLHGCGLGTILVERLAMLAEQRGITHFVAEVLSENRAMLDVLREGFDARVVRDAGSEMKTEFLTADWRLAHERFTDRLTSSPPTPRPGAAR